jgi:branched-chain amino acid transport system substrate-binding protein
MKHLKKFVVLVGLVSCVIGLSSFVWAQDVKEVRVGVIWPLTGPIPYLGNLCKSVTDLGEDLVNKKFDIDSPGNIFRSEGFPNLKGAKLRIITADDEGKPDVGRAAAERLITVDKVHALIGTVMSGVTVTISQVAEQYKIPMVNTNSTSPKLTQRGFKYFFRTTPHDEVFVGTILEFLRDLRDEKKVDILNIAVLCEDTQWGQDAADVIRKKAPEFGMKVVLDIAYPHEATNVDAEVIRVKDVKPNVIFMSSYDSDAMLFQKTFKKYDVRIPVVANNTGHKDTIFSSSLGSDADFVITRDLWSEYMLRTIPVAKQIDEMLKAKGNKEGMGESQGRVFIGFLTLMDAINRAGSTDPEAIRQALINTNISGNYLSLPWEGVKFDQTGQNIHGKPMMTQWQGGKLKAIWPWKIAETEIVWPLPPWKR